MTITRQDRQSRVLAWAREAFGPEESSSIVHRGLRLLEEAVEAAQAAGVDRAQAHRLLEYVYDRPVGELPQELGGLGITLLALSAAAGLDADACEQREFDRIMALAPEHFRQRNARKNAAGFSGTQVSASTPTPPLAR